MTSISANQLLWYKRRAMRIVRFAPLLALVLAACGGGAAPASSPSNAVPASPSVAASAKPAAAASTSAAASAKPAGSASAKPAASAAASGAAAAKPGAGDHVKVGTGPAVGSAGFFIGIDRGYFKDQGIDVEVVPFAGAAEMATPLAADQLDVINADPSTAFLNAIGRGIGIKFVADGGHTTKGHSSAAFLVRKDLIDSGAIKDYPDLKGKKINAVLKGSLVDMWANRILAKGGLKPADAELQYIPFPDSIGAMGNKALDAGMNVEPLTTSAVDKGVAVRWKGIDEIFGDLQNTVIMYSASFISQRPDVGKRFMVGYLHGVRDYMDAFENNKDRDAIVSILTKNTSVKDPALYSRMSMPVFDRNGAMLPASMKNMQQWWVDNGYVKTPVDIDKAIDMSFAGYAVGKLGKA